MKKLIIFFALTITVLNNHQNIVYAENESEIYAKIQSSDVYLSSTPSESTNLFELPYSYFVKVNEIVDDYYKISYKDIDGYVKKDKVKLMNGTPKNPYPNATFKLFVPYAIYTSPNQSSSQIFQLQNTSKILTYYGTITGQNVSSTNNVWYYCSLTENNTTYYGYIFSGITDNLTKFSVNTEIFDTVSDDIFNQTSSEFKSLSTSTKIMLIVAISVPSVLILYFLIKPSKIIQISNRRKQVNKEHKRTRHGDYFEFDENQL